jgi:glycosyltransferase involved in cell wall biosynthesis
VVGLLKSMDALLLPNQPSVIIRSGADIGQHTSPLKLFEYMATGKPIIASDLPVFDGVLSDGVNCLKVPATEPEAFCAAIRRLESDVGFAQRLGAQAQLEFRAQYTWDHRVARICSFIREIGLADPSGGALL